MRVRIGVLAIILVLFCTFPGLALGVGCFPEIVGNSKVPQDARGVFISNDHAYVADIGGGLQIVDVSSPAFPRIAASAETPDNNPFSVFTAVSHAYMANGEHGLIIFDVTKPKEPVQASAFKTSGAAMDAHVIDGCAYVATSEGLAILDMSSPETPAQVGVVKTDGPASSVQASGGYAYLLYDQGLAVIDVSDPAEAEILGTYTTPKTSAHHVFIQGRRA
jgi:hypothetical protein